MISQQVKNDACDAWAQYGEAIKKAFGFKGFIEAEPLLRVIEEGPEDRVRDWIEYIKGQTREIEKMEN